VGGVGVGQEEDHVGGEFERREDRLLVPRAAGDARSLHEPPHLPQRPRVGKHRPAATTGRLEHALPLVVEDQVKLPRVAERLNAGEKLPLGLGPGHAVGLRHAR